MNVDEVRLLNKDDKALINDGHADVTIPATICSSRSTVADVDLNVAGASALAASCCVAPRGVSSANSRSDDTKRVKVAREVWARYQIGTTGGCAAASISSTRGWCALANSIDSISSAF